MVLIRSAHENHGDQDTKLLCHKDILLQLRFLFKKGSYPCAVSVHASQPELLLNQLRNL